MTKAVSNRDNSVIKALLTNFASHGSIYLPPPPKKTGLKDQSGWSISLILCFKEVVTHFILAT